MTWHEAICSVSDDGSDTAHALREQCANGSDPRSNPERLETTAAFAAVAAIDSLGTLPMIVVTAADHPFPGLDPDEEAHLNETWNTGQTHWTALSSSAQPVSVDDSGHYIHLDHPNLVVDQVQQLLD